jgi:hypothetical protein
VTLYELVAVVDRPHHAACGFPTRHISKIRKEGRSDGTHSVGDTGRLVCTILFNPELVEGLSPP